ncbi:unnamed protein product [Hyaloperonospora brassicae]|uniref:Uncharacterized protein n=1 Tax=Hyaloperonospora brassicae TaxID=162125 RepID=A0AAV0UKE3_HYABA|nr:unnamed protein product [Hyaloperonospora brassicae]
MTGPPTVQTVSTTTATSEHVLPLLAAPNCRDERLERSGYVSFALKPEPRSHRRQFATTTYGSMPVRACAPPRKRSGLPLAPRPRESDALLGSNGSSNNNNSNGSSSDHSSETESDSDSSCTASSSTASTSTSLQSILRIPSADFSCRSLKKHTSVEFALEIRHVDDDDDNARNNATQRLDARCMPRRLTMEEKTALYQVRPDLELVPTVLLLSELEELQRRRQRKLMVSLLGASLVLLMMIVFYYLVAQM